MSKDWIKKMDMKPGALHRQLGVPMSYTFNKAILKRINKTEVKGSFMFEEKKKIMTPLLKKRVTLAITLMSLKKEDSKKPSTSMALTEKQEQQLEKHKVHHSTKHIASMRKMMKEGSSFSSSHKKAMNMIGT